MRWPSLATKKEEKEDKRMERKKITVSLLRRKARTERAGFLISEMGFIWQTMELYLIICSK